MARWFFTILFMCFVMILLPFNARESDALTKLHAQLQDPEATQRVLAVQEIAHLHNQELYALLLPVLRDPDAQVRVAAAQAVEFYPNQEVQQVLLELLEDPDVAVRGAAARSYGSMHFDQAIEPLTKMLTDPAPEVRAGAISGLGKIYRLPLLDTLIKATTDPAPLVRAAAARALENITDLPNWTSVPANWNYQLIETPPDKTYAALNKECRWDEIIAGLTKLMQDPDAMVRVNATIALSKFYKDIPAERYLEALSFPDAKVRYDLMWINFNTFYDLIYKHPQVLDAICAAFAKEQDADARKAMAFCLRSLQDKRVIPTLKAALKEQNPLVLSEIIRALYSTHDPSLAKDLLPFAHHANPQVRSLAIAGLGELHYSAAEDLCLQALHDPDKVVRANAISALGNLKSHKAITPLLAILKTGDEELMWSTIPALGNIGDPKALDGLLDYTTTNEGLHCTLIFNLALYKDPRVEAKILAALQDSNQRVQATAFSAVQQLSSNNVASRLVAIMLQDGNVDKRRMATQALSRKRDPRIVMSFVAALKDADVEVRRTAVTGLAQLHDLRIIKPLLLLAQAKNEPDSNIRRQALQQVLSYDTVPADCNQLIFALLKDTDTEVRRLSAEAVRHFKIPR